MLLAMVEYHFVAGWLGVMYGRVSGMMRAYGMPCVAAVWMIVHARSSVPASLAACWVVVSLCGLVVVSAVTEVSCSFMIASYLGSMSMRLYLPSRMRVRRG